MIALCVPGHAAAGAARAMTAASSSGRSER